MVCAQNIQERTSSFWNRISAVVFGATLRWILEEMSLQDLKSNVSFLLVSGVADVHLRRSGVVTYLGSLASHSQKSEL